MAADIPKVSIVMPTYNQADFLPDAVASVLRQTFGEFELIVVNDGATDETSEVLKGFSDGRIRILNQENRGASAALNAGFNVSRGKYLTWLASDNLYKSQFLEKMVTALESESVDMVYACFENIDADGSHIDYVFLEEYYDGLLLVNPGAVGVAFLYRRHVYDACGDFEDLVCNDLAYWLKASERFTFGFVPEVLASNRKHDAMQTVMRRDELARQTEMVINRHLLRGCAEVKIPAGRELLCFQQSTRRLIRVLEASLRSIETGRPVDVMGEVLLGTLVVDLLRHAGVNARRIDPDEVSVSGNSVLLPLSPEIEKKLPTQAACRISLRNPDGTFEKWY